MRPQSAKAKGRRLQQAIVQDLLNTFLMLTEDDIRSTSMGANGEDVQLSAAAKRVIPYSIEAKNQEKLCIWNAIRQSRSNCNGMTPIVVFKKNGENPHVAMDWKIFLNLISPQNVQATDNLKAAISIIKTQILTIESEICAAESESV